MVIDINTILQKYISMLERNRIGGMNNWLFIPLFFLACESQAQFSKRSFGPVIGFYKPDIDGGAILGDVVVIRDPTIPNSEPLIGFFYRYELNKHLQFSNEVLFSQHVYSFTIYNQAEQCQFCPVNKGGVIGMNIIEVLPALKLTIVRSGKFSALLFGGFSAQFRFDSSTSADVSYGNKHPGVAEVSNQIDEAFKPVMGFLSYGLEFNYGRFFVSTRLQEMLGETFTNNISLDGVSYPLNLKNKYVSFSSGYRFYSLKRKKRQ
jgi:hypothetical protein